MPESGLSADVEQFISDHIRTVEHLEVVLAVAAAPQGAASAPEVFAKVRSSEASVRERLDELANEGLLTRDGDRFQISTKSPATRDTINELARAYKERSIRVIQTIYSDRRRAMRELSDAFRFRRKEKDG
jgi:DNA-binding IclR family transcriptional regulator